MELNDHTKGRYLWKYPSFWEGNRPPLCGCIYLSHSSHEIGHTASSLFFLHSRTKIILFKQNEDSTVNASLVGCGRYKEGMKFLDEMVPLADCANLLIKTVDKKCFDKLSSLREKMIKQSPHVKSICAVTPSLHSTFGVVSNRISGRHRDSKDAAGIWAVIFVIGSFTGGEMIFSMTEENNKDVIVPFKSGDAILLKARDVYHEVKVWDGDIRITLVYYTTNAVVEEYSR